MNIAEESNTALGESNIPGRKMLREVYSPTFEDDPKAELRHLVLQHKAIIRTKQSIEGQHRDREARCDLKDKDGNVVWKKGDKIPCKIPSDIRKEMEVLAEDVLGKRAKRIEGHMTKTLKQLPIYTEFLADVYGAGPVVSAYLTVFINFGDRPNGASLKPSNLRRYCGMAVIDGRLEGKTAGKANSFNSDIRVRLYQMFGSMWKNAAKTSISAPTGKTSKYLTIWANYKQRMTNSARVINGKKIVNGAGREVSLKGFVHSTGWHKAADVFLEDLYIMGRAIEGLPVWPTYQTSKLGYTHGARVSDGSPVLLTVEQAKAIIGEVRAVPRAVTAPILEDEEFIDEEIAAE